jgi:hypothetical protein
MGNKTKLQLEKPIHKNALTSIAHWNSAIRHTNTLDEATRGKNNS